MTWAQNYAPLGSVGASALVAVLPVATLLGLLAFWHIRAHVAAIAGLAVALLIATAVYRMPAQLAVVSACYGAAYGLFPIGWIIINAIFVYQLSVETGQFAILQNQVAGVSSDRRIQALLIAFSFGAFIEGAAGFGTPVAITGALLIGLGFHPLEAAKLALIGNTAPVAFGALGTPLLTLARITNLDLQLLSSMVGRQLALMSLIVPFWLVAAQVGWRRMLEVWPACLVTGVSFAATQFLMSNFHGPWLVGIVSAFVSLAALLVLLRVWRPRSRRRKEADACESETCPPSHAGGYAGLKAWLPWILLSLFVFLWGLPKVKSSLNVLYAPNLAVPLLHNRIQRVPPVVVAARAEEAVFACNFPSATGTALLLAGIVSGFCLGMRPRRLGQLYLETIWRLRFSLLTIAVMLALGFTTRYSGTDATMGLALAATGPLFPFFSPLIGWLGVALTGSDTSSNVLFGNLQQVTAQRLNLSPILMASSNSSGGVMGKMIDAQSIVVASVATGGHPESPDAGTVLRSVFWHSLALAVLVGILVLLQARLWTWMIPG
jgi:lactate permease